MPTPFEILVGLFGPDWASNAHICHVAPGANTWGGYRVSSRFPDPERLTLPSDHSNYVSIGMASRATDTRSNGNVIIAPLIALDDVGTKVPLTQVEAMVAQSGMKPLMVVETSDNNFQYFFRLDQPVHHNDFDHRDRVVVLETIRHALRQGNWGDPKSHDAAHYMRLPFGINGKEQHRRADGTYPEAKLALWNPEARVALEQVAEVFVGADWQEQVKSFAPGKARFSSATIAGDYSAAMDDPYVQLAAHLGLNPYQAGPGKIGATCPNVAEHTNSVDDGFAILGPHGGKCHHAHCLIVSGDRAGFWFDLLEQQYEENIAADLAAGRLVESEGRLKDTSTGEFVQRTAIGWMANQRFAAVPLTFDDLDWLNAVSAAYESRVPEFVRQLNSRFAMVRTHKGVVDFSGHSNRLYELMPVDHFCRMENGLKVPDGKRMIGAGTAWLDHPAAPRYERMDLYGPGIEPPGVLNLFKGLPVGSARFSRTGQFLSDETDILAFIHEAIASGRQQVSEYVLNWLAWVTQHPLEKPGVNLLLIGGQGTGKSTLAKMFVDIFGPQLAMVVNHEKHVLGNFNAHLEHKLAIVFDEAIYGRDPRFRHL